jgi:hypothetical protein
MKKIVYQALLYFTVAVIIAGLLGMIFLVKDSGVLNAGAIVCLVFMILGMIGLVVLRYVYAVFKKRENEERK